MPGDERERLTRRAKALRRLQEGIDDTKARDAITEEIAKHEALLAEIDKMAASENTPAIEETVAKGPGDVIS